VLEHLAVDRVEVVPVPADCRDGFFAAYWRRPHAYLDPGAPVDLGAGPARRLDPRPPGLARLADDLATGEWERRNRDVLSRDEMDFGYRLVVA
jgi:hypothetical protein